MAKQTKRARKFEAKGGVKARLEKGTITKKGKLKHQKQRRKTDGSGAAEHLKRQANKASEEAAAQAERKRNENDFVDESNIGDLNIDDFFSTAFDNDASKEPKNDDASVEEESSSDEGDKKASSEDGSSSGNNDDSDEDDSAGSDDEEDLEKASERMKLEMEKLQEADPDFHKFLKENESSLLEFGDGEDQAMNDEEQDDDDEASREQAVVDDEEKEKQADSSISMSNKLLNSLHQGAFQAHGIKSLRKVVSAYKSACHLSDASQDDDDNRKKNERTYLFDSSALFDQLMLMCLNRCHDEFRYHLLGKGSVEPSGSESKKQKKKKNQEDDHDDDNVDFDDSKPLNPKLLMKSYKWPEVKPILQTFFKATIHILKESKEPKLLTFILKALSKYMPFLTPLPKVATSMLTTLTSLWSAPLDTSEDYQVVRLNAFLRIRQLALTQPFPFIEECLKKTYLAYAKRAKFGTASSVTSQLPTLTFMGNCVVELYSLDYHSSYQHAFVYIRQLALHLRTALQKKTPESFQAVYCWQYMHCLKLWTAVLTASLTVGRDDDNDNENDGDEDMEYGARPDEAKLLRSLVYPLAEVLYGVARLVPTTRHLPLRFVCVRLLQQLAAASEMFIPTTSILLEVLDLKEIHMKPKRIKGRSTTRGLVLPLILKLPKEAPLRTSEQLESCISEVYLLLNREVDLYKYSAGFPEFSVRICQHLRKFAKETKNGRWRAYAKGCIELCDKNVAFAVKGRSLLTEAPKDVKRLEVLKPTNVPNMHKRYDASVSKEKPLLDSAASVRPASKVSKRKLVDDDEEMEEEDIQNQENSKEDDSEDEDEKPKKKKTKKTKKKQKEPIKVNEADLKNTKALEEEDDVVEEGVSWLDEDSD